MSKIPKIKKQIKSFLVGEEGKISKQSLIKVGAVLGIAALGSALLAKNIAAGHSHSIGLSGGGHSWTGSHTHHSSSSGSHSSHSSGCSSECFFCDGPCEVSWECTCEICQVGSQV